MWRARTACSLTNEQVAALDKLAQASGTKVVQRVRDLGHYPKASTGRSLAERQLAWKLRTALNAKQFSPEQEAELQALRLVQQVRELGDYPKVRNAACSCSERQLALKLGRALNAEQLSPEQEAGLQALRDASPKQEEEFMLVSPEQEADLPAPPLARTVEEARKAEELMQEVRDFGRYPKESRQNVPERKLAEKLRRALKVNQLSPEQKS